MRLALNRINRRDIEIFFLYSFAFLCMITIAGATICIWTLTFIVMSDKNRWHLFYKNPIFILFVLSNIYVILSGIYGYIHLPFCKNIQIRETLDWIRLWLFLSVGLVINGDEKVGLNVLKFLYVGFFTSIIFYLLNNPTVLLTMPRVGFGHKILSISLYLCIAILGVSIFSQRMYSSVKDKNYFYAYLIFWCINLILMIDALLITRSRTAWFSILLILPIILIIYYRKNLNYRKINIKWTVAILTIILVSIVFNFKLIKNRMLLEYPTFKAILEGHESAINLNSSTGARYFLYKFAIKKIEQRPFFGWGAGVTPCLIKTSTHPRLQVRVGSGYEWLDHLHDNYLEILVRFGVIGAILMLCTLIILIRRLTRSYRKGTLSQDTYLFLIGSLALIILCGLTNFRLLHPDYRFFWACIGGLIYGLGLCSEKRDFG